MRYSYLRKHTTKCMWIETVWLGLDAHWAHSQMKFRANWKVDKTSMFAACSMKLSTRIPVCMLAAAVWHTHWTDSSRKRHVNISEFLSSIAHLQKKDEHIFILSIRIWIHIYEFQFHSHESAQSMQWFNCICYRRNASRMDFQIQVFQRKSFAIKIIKTE